MDICCVVKISSLDSYSTLQYLSHSRNDVGLTCLGLENDVCFVKILWALEEESLTRDASHYHISVNTFETPQDYFICTEIHCICFDLRMCVGSAFCHFLSFIFNLIRQRKSEIDHTFSILAFIFSF